MSTTLDYPSTNPEAPQGHPGHLTSEQESKVVQLRAALQQAGCTERLDDPSMCRFLRARKWDINLAKEMFLNCEKWRREFGVDEIAKNFQYPEKEAVSKYYPQYYHKTDKDGRPVYIEQLGGIDLKKMYEITTQERMMQNLVYEYEKFVDPRLPACSRKAGKLIETSCTILDLKGVGITSISSVYGYVKQASQISSDYYPERLGKMFLINAPWGFSGAWKMVAKLLDPATVAKINILGSSYQSELLAQIPAENLPKQFGGKCDCADRGGNCAMSDAGPWNDPQYLK
ncbi:Sec14 cytosolic factor [Saitoella complicata NRRL Y-17804]|uniref:Sec14 cytosolic factor n=1 Tax=Saitoella complicata (strain BCRC 22490 / CBS 7301 / JCM 7358 / NBRC 10748 / NRRL Y-17804) TaxID=698492 RepID=UPI00086803CF|nr:Sec14 cytosolic factor [Saitoella complicata NRRL Y-17804]ODQ56558.1 Sec14 cytosolic factor [Saitoella complicata NRRL Y-17804]